MSENNKNDWKEREVGALWFRKNENDPKKSFFSGKVSLPGEFGGTTDIDVVAFLTPPEGPEDNKPNFKIYKSRPREEGQTAGTSNGGNKGNAPKATATDDDLAL